MRVRVLTAALAIVLSLGLLTSGAWSDDFALVRNTRNPIAALSRQEIRDMAVGRKKAWPHGPVAVLILPRPGTPELHWFATSVVGVPESLLMARIKELVFRGEMRKPIMANNPQEVLAALANETGGLGVIPGDVAKKLPEGVAILSVR